MSHYLEADGIQLSFGFRKILSDIYLRCETGFITGLLGRNGTGKSCLMNIIFGSLACADKSIRFDHKKLNSPYLKPGLIKFLPQHHFIPRHLSVARVFSDSGLDWKDFAKRFSESAIQPDNGVRDLSGGQRRLLELYMVLAANSRFVLLDEPFTHINPPDAEKIKTWMKEEKQRKGILLTDHMYQHITEIADALYLLKDGKTWPVKGRADLESLGYLSSGRV